MAFYPQNSIPVLGGGLTPKPLALNYSNVNDCNRPKVDIPTPMKEDMEVEYSTKLVLYKPVLEKLAQILGGTIIEQFCTCGHDKRRRFLVLFSTIPPCLVCGERAKAGHKVPDALKPAPSYLAFIHRMVSAEVIPQGIFELAASKQNVKECMKILVEFMTPIMKQLQTMMQKPEAKKLDWDVLVVGEKDTPRAELGYSFLKEWGEWCKGYWTPLEKELIHKLENVPKGTDATPFVRKTEEEIEKSREEGRKQGEINNAIAGKSLKRKAPLLPNTSPNGKQFPSPVAIQNGHYDRGYSPGYGAPSAPPYYRHPYESYPPAPPPPPPYPERNPYLQPAEPRPSQFFPAPSASRKSLLPTPGMPSYGPPTGYPNQPGPSYYPPPPKQGLSEPQKKAEQLHQAIQYMVSLFEERYTKPDGTQFAVMESPIVKRAVNLEYRSIQEAETILNALKTTWDEVTGQPAQSSAPKEIVNHLSSPQTAQVEIISFNSQTYHRRRIKEEVNDGQKAVWTPTGKEAYRLVTVIHVKRQKAVIDSNNPEDDLEIVELRDLFLPGY